MGRGSRHSGVGFRSWKRAPTAAPSDGSVSGLHVLHWPRTATGATAEAAKVANVAVDTITTVAAVGTRTTAAAVDTITAHQVDLTD